MKQPLRWAIGLVIAFGVYVGSGAALMNHVTQKTDPLDAVVYIDLDGGHGSGVHLGNGLILTAAHVTTGEQRITVKGEQGQKVDGKVLWFNKDYDIALVETSYTGPSAQLTCSVQRVGAVMRLVGYPKSMGLVRTWGHISASVSKRAYWNESYLVDIASLPGNSGGPMFDSRGRVAGILVGGSISEVLVPKHKGKGFVPEVGFVSNVGYSYAVPSSTVCRLMGRSS
jgi:serine protease Do